MSDLTTARAVLEWAATQTPCEDCGSTHTDTETAAYLAEAVRFFSLWDNGPRIMENERLRQAFDAVCKETRSGHPQAYPILSDLRDAMKGGR